MKTQETRVPNPYSLARVRPAENGVAQAMRTRTLKRHEELETQELPVQIAVPEELVLLKTLVAHGDCTSAPLDILWTLVLPISAGNSMKLHPLALATVWTMGTHSCLPAVAEELKAASLILAILELPIVPTAVTGEAPSFLALALKPKMPMTMTKLAAGPASLEILLQAAREQARKSPVLI